MLTHTHTRATSSLDRQAATSRLAAISAIHLQKKNATARAADRKGEKAELQSGRVGDQTGSGKRSSGKERRRSLHLLLTLHTAPPSRAVIGLLGVRRQSHSKCVCVTPLLKLFPCGSFTHGSMDQCGNKLPATFWLLLISVWVTRLHNKNLIFIYLLSQDHWD